MGNFMISPERDWSPDWLPPKPMQQSVTTALSLYAKEFRAWAPDLFSQRELPRTVIARMDHRHIEPAITVNITEQRLEVHSFFSIKFRNKNDNRKRLFVDYIPAKVTRELVHDLDDLDRTPLAQHMVHSFAELCGPLHPSAPAAVSESEKDDTICGDNTWLKGFARGLQDQLQEIYRQILTKSLPAHERS